METEQRPIHRLTRHDCGTAINKQSVEGQLEGSMCLAEALFEEVNSKGRVVKRPPGDYRIPTPVDAPNSAASLLKSYEPKMDPLVQKKRERELSYR